MPKPGTKEQPQPKDDAASVEEPKSAEKTFGGPHPDKTNPRMLADLRVILSDFQQKWEEHSLTQDQVADYLRKKLAETEFADVEIEYRGQATAESSHFAYMHDQDLKLKRRGVDTNGYNPITGEYEKIVSPHDVFNGINILVGWPGSISCYNLWLERHEDHWLIAYDYIPQPFAVVTSDPKSGEIEITRS